DGQSLWSAAHGRADDAHDRLLPRRCHVERGRPALAAGSAGSAARLEALGSSAAMLTAQSSLGGAMRSRAARFSSVALVVFSSATAFAQPPASPAPQMRGDGPPPKAAPFNITRSDAG